MAKLADLISILCKKTGVDPTEINKVIDGSEALKAAELPEEAVRAFDQRLMTVEQAKNNPELKSHFKATFFSTLDEKINGFFSEYQVDDETKAAILTDPSSFNRISGLFKSIREAETKKAAAASGNKQAHLDEIANLRKQVLEVTEKSKAEIAKKDTEYGEKMRNMLIRGHFGGYNYSDAFPKDVSVETALNLFNQRLAKEGAKAIMNGTGVKLVLEKDPDLPFTINNQEVTFSEMADKVVGENRMLKVKDDTPPAGSGQTNYTPPQRGADPNRIASQTLLAEVEAGFKDLKQ